jgi:hypothetical protein
MNSRTTPEPSPIFSVYNSLTNTGVLDRGINEFFNCSGKFFYVFSQEELARYQQYALEHDDLAIRKAAICYISAVAAVGTQYLHEVDTRGAEKSLYELTRYYFEDVLQSYPLHAVKVCILLALYNIIGKPTVALAHVGEFWRDPNLIKLYEVLMACRNRS